MSADTSSSDAFTISRAAMRRVAWAIVAIIVVVLLVAGGVALARNSSSKDPLAAAINSSEYQAVFLTNGQVYFGKLSAPGPGFYYLRHIYYLASQTSPQGSRTSGQRLVKLGN